MPTLVVMEPKECKLVEFYGRKDAKDGEEALKKWRAEREERYGAKEEEKKEWINKWYVLKLNDF